MIRIGIMTVGDDEDMRETFLPLLEKGGVTYFSQGTVIVMRDLI